MIKIKICGIKSCEDAKVCIDNGVDIIGIIVGSNNIDSISPELAKEICEYVNGRCNVSLVTRLESAEDIVRLTKYIGNDIIQLHSNILESEVEKIVKELPDIKIVRVIQITKDGTINNDISNIVYADWYLLDSYDYNNDEFGGTGTVHDWQLSRNIIDILDRPAFLTGGLNPYNVMDAIKITNPYGVDINSGCKNELGFKDYNKVKQFVENVNIIDRELEISNRDNIEEDDQDEDEVDFDYEDEIDIDEDLN